ncbi:hypothetical protein [Flavobacterium sp.]|uniref:hypothetical protein n=1 Tax=Flavobacterium sp. TaxID=239 RepID=UPI0025B9C183|nr:hypothetical protein [Flavobacterium sp.]MBA4153162.1 hypothetical protein [Flavobacterium sp.]
MSELLRINKRIIIKSYFWISGFLTIGFLVYLYFFYKEVTLKWLVLILIMTIVLCPLFIIGTWIYDWNRKRRYLKRILCKNPFSELEKIGFSKKTLITNHNSLKDYVPFTEINGIQLLIDIDITKPTIAEFTTYCSTFNLTHEQFSEKFNELKYKNIELGPNYLTKKIDTRKEKISIQNLEKMLLDLTHIVKTNKFEPVMLKEWKEL